MSRSIIKREAAKRDLDSHAAYIGEDSPHSAIRFLEAANESFQQIARMPELRVRCNFKNPSTGVIRRWHVRGFEDYLIFYIVLAERIEVIRVLQGARDIESIFSP